MIDAAPTQMAERESAAERLTVVPCPTRERRTGRRCGYTLVEAWTSSECVTRRRCKQCGVWYRVRLLAGGAATASPEVSGTSSLVI